MKTGKFIGNNQYSGLSEEDRFWQKVDKRSDDECWEWLGSTHYQWGYGHFIVSGKFMAAHRYSWILYNKQEIPNGMLICHKCDNPSCVNPHHLFLGTNKDNTQDKIKKGRLPSAVGSLNSRSILNEQAVKVIRYCCRNRVTTRKKLAVLYGVTKGTIDAIMSGRNWSHVI